MRAAESTARTKASTVSPIDGRIISSNSERTSRTCVFSPGNRTGITTSVSADRASLASLHSCRNLATAETIAGSEISNSPHASPTLERTCSNTSWSKSIPPRRSMPSERPSSSNSASGSLRTIAASKVPPPRSYTPTVASGSMCWAWAYATAAAVGSLTRVASARPSWASAFASSSCLCGPQAAGCVTAIPVAEPPSRSATRSTTQRTNFAASAWGSNGLPPTTSGVASPIRRLNSRTTRCGSVNARRVAASPITRDSSSATNTTDGTAAPRDPRGTTSICV